MKKILFFLVFLSTFIFLKSFAIEVTMLEAEKRIIFNQLFSKQTCGKIYEQIEFGARKKLKEEVLLKAYHNIKRVNIDEEKAILSIAIDQRTFSYKEAGLERVIFKVLAEQDFSEELAVINETVAISKTKKIVVCEYDLNSGLEDGKFFNFFMNYDNHLKVQSNAEPQVLIYYDGTVEYAYYDEQVEYAIPEFNYRMYPFDNHELRFNISSEIYDKLFMERSDQFKILLNETKDNDYNNISFPGWKIARYISFPMSEPLVDVYSDYSKHSIVSEFSFQRNWASYLFKLIMPIIGITFLTYAAVFMRLVDGRIVTLCSLLFTFVAFDFVSLGQTPELQYITLLDWLIFLGYTFNIITILFSISESYFLRQRTSAKASDLGDVDRVFLNRIRFYYKTVMPVTYLVTFFIGYYFMLI